MQTLTHSLTLLSLYPSSSVPPQSPPLSLTLLTRPGGGGPRIPIAPRTPQQWRMSPDGEIPLPLSLSLPISPPIHKCFRAPLETVIVGDSSTNLKTMSTLSRSIQSKDGRGETHHSPSTYHCTRATSRSLEMPKREAVTAVHALAAVQEVPTNNRFFCLLLRSFYRVFCLRIKPILDKVVHNEFIS